MPTMKKPSSPLLRTCSQSGSPVSPGCAHCYAEAQALRWNRTAFAGAPKMRDRVAVLREFLALRGGDIVFNNTMSDTFHEGVPDEWIQDIFSQCAEQPYVFHLFLTKRIERVVEMADRLTWAANIWIGTSVESARYAHRIDTLRQVPSAGHFVSFEPLLGDVGPVSLEGIDWAIVGGESGEKRRPFDPAWARHIRDVARNSEASFFYKQGSARYPGKDRLLDGVEYNEFPPAFGRGQQPISDPPMPPAQMNLWSVL